MPDEMNLGGLEPRSKRVTIANVKYVIREADTDTGKEYKNRTSKGLRFSEGKISGVEGIADVEPWLVHRCLFTLEGGSQTPLEEILRWPNHITQAIFDVAKEISGLARGQKVEDGILELCRKDLALKHHPDRGGNADVMLGVNLALDWIAEHQHQTDPKN